MPQNTYQEFIYKKSWPDEQRQPMNQPSLQEQLLMQLFYDQDVDSEMIDSTVGIEFRDQLDTHNRGLMLSKVFQCQGQYQGYFSYKNQTVDENYTIIFKKHPDLSLE